MDSTEGSPARTTRSERWKAFFRENGRYLVSIGASVVLTVVLLFLPIDYRALGNYGYLGVFLATMLPSATVILPSPTLAATYIAGGFLNPLLVGSVAGLGATVGELTGYLAGYGGGGLIADNPHYRRAQRWIKRVGLLPVIFVFALVPNPLFDLTGIAAGAMRLPLWQFLLICFLGKSLRFVLIAWLGERFPLPWW